MQSSVAVINVPQHQQTFVAAINFRTKTTPREFIDGELNFLGKFFFLLAPSNDFSDLRENMFTLASV